MTPEQKQRAIKLIAGWRAVFWRDAGNDMAALLQELIDTPEPEPFGHFKAEPFGWTDCSETDEGAIALYSAPPVNNQSEHHLEMVNPQAPSVPAGLGISASPTADRALTTSATSIVLVPSAEWR